MKFYKAKISSYNTVIRKNFGISNDDILFFQVSDITECAKAAAELCMSYSVLEDNKRFNSSIYNVFYSKCDEYTKDDILCIKNECNIFFTFFLHFPGFSLTKKDRPRKSFPKVCLFSFLLMI